MDEIRRRRIERLAMLDRARQQEQENAEGNSTDSRNAEVAPSSPAPGSATASATPSHLEQVTPKPAQSVSQEAAPVQGDRLVSRAPTQPDATPGAANTQDAAPVNAASAVATPAQKASSKPAPKSVRPARREVPPSPIFVLGLSEGDADWDDQAGVDGLMWSQLLSESTAGRGLVYLMSSYDRAAGLRRLKPDTADEVQASLVRLAVIAVTAAEDDEVYSDAFTQFVDAAREGRLNEAFVHQLFTAVQEDTDDFDLLMTRVIDAIKMPRFGSPVTSIVFRVLTTVLEAPGVAEQALKLPDTPLPLTPEQISSTVLGRVFSNGVANMGLQSLHGISMVAEMGVEEATENARQAAPMTQVLNNLQLRLVERLVRQSAATRKLVLGWFTAVLDANHLQTAMARVPGKTNTFELMLSAFRVLLHLAEPFVKLEPTQLRNQLLKINSGYYSYKVSMNVSDETKVLAPQDAPFNSRTVEEPPLNFVTECFFLTAGFLHYGFSAAAQALSGSLKQHVARFQQERDRIVSEVQRMPEAARQLIMARFDSIVAQYKSEYAGLMVSMHEPQFLGRVLRFSEFLLTFDVCVAEDRPARIEMRVPWNKDPPESYASFPEFMVEAPVVAAGFVLRSQEFVQNPAVVGGGNYADYELLIDACIFFMSSPKVLRNPYLRSKFVEVLYFGGADIPLTSGASVPGAFQPLFTTSATCRKFLLPALMSAFIDIEHTGRNAQFYEKFTVREFVSSVLQVLWRDPHYRQQLILESEHDADFFVRFVALLLNDATYLLDEALGKLLEVNKLQNELSDAASGGTHTPVSTGSRQPSTEPTGARASREGADDTDQQNDEDGENEGGEDEEPSDPESRLRSAERAAQNFLQLSNSTMALLNTFTSTVPRIFSTPEIIDRFAVMLNYNLAALVGPKCNELKVRERERLGFNPRQLLSDLVRIYLGLRKEPPFPKALAKDERSYRDANFRKAHHILAKRNLISPIQLDELEWLADRTQEAWKEAQEEEEDFGDDVPDEYLDPLMYTIMENPVMLPTSKVNIDLSTIKSHLLSDPTDPFNRVPLKIEDVVPNEELRREIAEFRKSKKQQRAAPADPDAMAE